MRLWLIPVLILLLALPTAAQLAGPQYKLAVSEPAYDYRADLPGEKEQRFMVVEEGCPNRLFRSNGTIMTLDIRAPDGITVQAPHGFAMPAHDCLAGRSVYRDFTIEIRIADDVAPQQATVELTLVPGDAGLPYDTDAPVTVRIPILVKEVMGPEHGDDARSEDPRPGAVSQGGWTLLLLAGAPAAMAVVRRPGRRKT